MANEKISVKNLGREEQKLLAYGVFISCFIMALKFCPIMKLHLTPRPTYFHVESMKPVITNMSNSRSDVYEIYGDIRVHGISSSIFIASGHDDYSSSWNIKPHPRKPDEVAMKKVRPFKIITNAADRIPRCSQNFDIPAILFSTGGHAGNYFHDLADVLLPLFLTSHQFNRKVIFLTSDHGSEWMAAKYRLIFEKLSKYNIYDIENENEVLCFSRMIIGLKADKDDMAIDPSEFTNFSSLRSFTRFLRSAYSLDRESVHDHRTTSRPRILIVSRERSRKLMNGEEIDDVARSMGYDVVLKELSRNVSQTAKLVNSLDVMVGVHGSGLTNEVFLPENAILIQIIPFGLDDLAEYCYETPGKGMGLRYLEYKVSSNESTLFGKYPSDSEFYRNPKEIFIKKGYHVFHDVYMDNQDVNLDLDRFRKTLLRALELLN